MRGNPSHSIPSPKKPSYSSPIPPSTLSHPHTLPPGKKSPFAPHSAQKTSPSTKTDIGKTHSLPLSLIIPMRLAPTSTTAAIIPSIPMLPPMRPNTPRTHRVLIQDPLLSRSPPPQQRQLHHRTTTTTNTNTPGRLIRRRRRRRMYLRVPRHGLRARQLLVPVLLHGGGVGGRGRGVLPVIVRGILCRATVVQRGWRTCRISARRVLRIGGCHTSLSVLVGGRVLGGVGWGCEGAGLVVVGGCCCGGG